MDLYFPENAIDSVNEEDIKHQINENAEAFSSLGTFAIFRIDTEYTDVIQVLTFKGLTQYSFLYFSSEILPIIKWDLFNSFRYFR